MEHRPPFEPPAVPTAPRPRVGSMLAGVVLGFLGGIMPFGMGFLVLLTPFNSGRDLTLKFLAIAMIVLLALFAAAARLRRTRSGFGRGVLIGASLSLLLTGGSVSALAWMCRSGL